VEIKQRKFKFPFYNFPVPNETMKQVVLSLFLCFLIAGCFAQIEVKFTVLDDLVNGPANSGASAAFTFLTQLINHHLTLFLLSLKKKKIKIKKIKDLPSIPFSFAFRLTLFISLSALFMMLSYQLISVY